MSRNPIQLPRLAILIACALGLAALSVPLWSGPDDREPQVESPAVARFEFANPGTTTGWHTIEPLDAVEARNAFRLDLQLSEPMAVYIVSFDFVRGHAAMIPSAQLRSDLRSRIDAEGMLSAGRQQLPGEDQGRGLVWQTGESIGSLDVFVVASREPLREFEGFLSRCRQVGNRAFPKERVLDLYAPSAGMEVTPTRSRLGDPLLQEIQAMRTIDHDGPLLPVPGNEGVYATVLRLRTPLSEGTGNPLEAFNERLQQVELPAPPTDPSTQQPTGQPTGR